jgi:hypothetical protein
VLYNVVQLIVATLSPSFFTYAHAFSICSERGGLAAVLVGDGLPAQVALPRRLEHHRHGLHLPAPAAAQPVQPPRLTSVLVTRIILIACHARCHAESWRERRARWLHGTTRHY